MCPRRRGLRSLSWVYLRSIRLTAKSAPRRRGPAGGSQVSLSGPSSLVLYDPYVYLYVTSIMTSIDTPRAADHIIISRSRERSG